MSRTGKSAELSTLRNENRRLAMLGADRDQELYAVIREVEQLRKDNELMEEYCLNQDVFHAGTKEQLDAAQKQLHRERQETAKWRNTAIAGVVIMALTVMAVAAVFFAPIRAEAEERMDPTVSTTASSSNTAETVQVIEEPPETDENALIEAALFESGYFRGDIPLDGDTQAELHAACDEFGIQYELALAVIHQETNYQNIVGDGGKSIGYMQVQPRWHQARMAELGIRDLSIPYDNFRTGCSILAETIDHYGLVGGLTAYNTGAPGTSAYATEVLAYMGTLEAK